jgi:hypothetical protein
MANPRVHLTTLTSRLLLRCPRGESAIERESRAACVNVNGRRGTIAPRQSLTESVNRLVRHIVRERRCFAIQSAGKRGIPAALMAILAKFAGCCSRIRRRGFKCEDSSGGDGLSAESLLRRAILPRRKILTLAAVRQPGGDRSSYRRLAKSQAVNSRIDSAAL